VSDSDETTDKLVGTALKLAQIRQATADAERLELGNLDEAARTAFRKYHFCEPIVDKTTELCIAVLTKWMHVSDDPITVEFNSPGGSIFAGFALYDFICESVASGQYIETTATGYAASMAGVALQAGTERTMRPNAYFMAHEAKSVMSGSMSGFRDEVELLERLQERCISVLTSRTGRKTTAARLKSKTLRKAWWLDAPEALAAGFVDRIVVP
jgi:ATP-dependent protease ClpP protease subunit